MTVGPLVDEWGFGPGDRTERAEPTPERIADVVGAPRVVLSAVPPIDAAPREALVTAIGNLSA